MNYIENVATTFEKFTKYLEKERSKDLKTIGRITNGLEKWLTFEFYLWLLMENEGMKPGHGSEETTDVGLEYRVLINREKTKTGKPKKKQCDIFIRSSKGFHYVEIKAPINNGNCSKVLASAVNDLRYMKKIKQQEDPSTGNLIVFGIGFDDEDWKNAKNKITNDSGLPCANGSKKRELISNIRWGVWTKEYR